MDALNQAHKYAPLSSAAAAQVAMTACAAGSAKRASRDPTMPAQRCGDVATAIVRLDSLIIEVEQLMGSLEQRLQQVTPGRGPGDVERLVPSPAHGDLVAAAPRPVSELAGRIYALAARVDTHAALLRSVLTDLEL